MKILFNCSVNRVGGAIQNAANFIAFASKDREHSFTFLVSPQVYDVLERWRIIDSRVKLCQHPLSSVSARRHILSIESRFRPDVVYTMAGPSYIKFRSLHVLGISDPYITHAELKSFVFGRTPYGAISHLLKSAVKGVWSRFEGEYFVFQTRTSRNGFCYRYRLSSGKTRVVPNAIGKSFTIGLEDNFCWQDSTREQVVIFVPSADYPHKDLGIIARLAKNISSDTRSGPHFKFIITVPEGSRLSHSLALINDISERVSVVNIGPFSYADAWSLYQSCDVVFIPSILETFSTAYLEALAVGKFLLVADKPFAKEICGGAAHYFRPGDGNSAYQALQFISCHLAGPDRASALEVIDEYGGFSVRYRRLLDFFLSLQKRRHGGVHNVQ